MGKVQCAMKAGATRGQPAYQMLCERVLPWWQATMIEMGRCMGRQARGYLLWKSLRTACQVECRVRCRAYGDMVGVAIQAIRPKGEHHVGAKGPEQCGHFACQALLVLLLELAIAIVQAAHMLYAERLAGTVEFLRPHLPQRPARGRLGITDLP